MWGDEIYEWQQNEDELGFEFFGRVLGSVGSEYGNEDYNEEDPIPLFYRVLKYGICKLD